MWHQGSQRCALDAIKLCYHEYDGKSTTKVVCNIAESENKRSLEMTMVRGGVKSGENMIFRTLGKDIKAENYAGSTDIQHI